MINQKMNFKIPVLLIAISGFTLTMFQNCTSNLSTQKAQFNQASGGTSNGLDTSEPNNKPLINCNFSSDQRAHVYAEISTIDDKFSSEKFNENDSLNIDCGKTYDEDSVNQLTFELDDNYDSSNPNFLTISSSYKLASYSPGIYNMALRVTDPQGEVSLKTFSLVVECGAAVPAPSIGNPTTAIQVSEGAQVGQYNFSVNSGDVSGGSGFMYSWDFNGDGVLDPYSTTPNGSKNLWTANTSIINQYVNVTGNRPVRLNVRNSCFKITSYEMSQLLPTSHSVARNASSLATNTGYYYLQGDTRDLNNSTNVLDIKRKNADYLATDNSGYTEFSCDFKKPNNGRSSIYINTRKQYRDEAYASHGMMISIDNIPDSGADGTQTIGIGQANVRDMSYTLAGESDGIITKTYRLSGACDIKLRIIRATSTSPCASGPARTDQSIEFMGEFNCSQLIGPDGDGLSITNGKFYCGDSISDRCQGGGGGGGGQPPPQF